MQRSTIFVEVWTTKMPLLKNVWVPDERLAA
jgi:hypothetical protein